MRSIPECLLPLCVKPSSRDGSIRPLSLFLQKRAHFQTFIPCNPPILHDPQLPALPFSLAAGRLDGQRAQLWAAGIQANGASNCMKVLWSMTLLHTLQILVFTGVCVSRTYRGAAHTEEIWEMKRKTKVFILPFSFNKHQVSPDWAKTSW